MGRALKYLFRLAVLAAIGLVAYAYLDELPPPTRSVEVELPVPAGDGAPPEPARASSGTEASPPVEDGADGVMQE